MSQIKPIKTQADHNRVVKRLYELMDMDEATMPEHLSDELSVLATLLDAYEAVHYPIEKADPISIIEFHMDQRNVTRSDLASCIGSAKKVSQILSGKRPLTLKMIRALSEQLKIPAEMLFDQSKFGLPKNDLSIDWDKFPISALAKNKFLKDRRDPKDYSEEIIRELFLDAGGEDNIPALLFRTGTTVRQTSKTDRYALQAWCLYVLAEARSLNIEGRYKLNPVDTDFLRTIAQLSSLSDGPIKAKESLLEAGIALIYAPHLPKTFLDGVALVTKEGVPVVGMTIRHDRLDSFWFCLLHELAHIGWHLKDSREYFIDDLSGNETEFCENGEKEREADSLAQNALIPEEIWTKFKNQKSITSDEVYAIAHEAAVHPSLVANRVRRETGNYRILNQFIKSGEVRKHFDRGPHLKQ